MKKVYIAIFLFVSLFFFYSNGVKADTYDFTISSNAFDSINNTFFEFRDLVIQHAQENNYYYYISSDGANFMAYYFADHDLNFIYNNSRITLSSLPVFYAHIYSNGSISKYSTSSTNIIIRTSTYYFYDTNYLEFKYSDIEEVNINYGSCSYTLTDGGKVRTLYDFYLASQNSCTFADEVVEDIHKEEKEVLSNFYNLIFEKINLLANSIINNYIYLTVIGIFILIFLIYLIRRYFI